MLCDPGRPRGELLAVGRLRTGSDRRDGTTRPIEWNSDIGVQQEEAESCLPEWLSNPSGQPEAVSRNPRVTIGAQGANVPWEWALRWPTTAPGVPGSCGSPRSFLLPLTGLANTLREFRQSTRLVTKILRFLRLSFPVMHNAQRTVIGLDVAPVVKEMALMEKHLVAACFPPLEEAIGVLRFEDQEILLFAPPDL